MSKELYSRIDKIKKDLENIDKLPGLIGIKKGQLMERTSANEIEKGNISNELVKSEEEYNKITNGMTYEECVSIIGFEGEEMSTVHQDGIPGVMEAMTVQIYMWQNSGGSNMNATFTNGKLDMKAQFGL